jgi:hypothetical protein
VGLLRYSKTNLMEPDVVGFEVNTEVTMKSIAWWDETPYRLPKGCSVSLPWMQRHLSKFSMHGSGNRIRTPWSGRSSVTFRRNTLPPSSGPNNKIRKQPARNQQGETSLCLLLTWLSLRPCRWKKNILPKHQ